MNLLASSPEVQPQTLPPLIKDEEGPASDRRLDTPCPPYRLASAGLLGNGGGRQLVLWCPRPSRCTELHLVKDEATCTPFLCSASFPGSSSCSAVPSLSTQPSAPHLCPSLQPSPWEDPSPPPVLYLPSEKPSFLNSALDPSLLLPHNSPSLGLGAPCPPSSCVSHSSFSSAGTCHPVVIPTFLISANILTMGQSQLRALKMGCCAQGHSPAQAWPTSSMRLGLPGSPLQPPPLPGPSLPHHPGAAHTDELTSSQASLSTSQPLRGGHCPCSQQPEGHSWSATHCEGTRVLLLTPADPCTNRQPGPTLHTGHKHRPRALCRGQPWLPATPPIHAEGAQLKAGCRHPQHWARRRVPSVRPLAQAPPPLGSPPRLSQPP